MKKDDQNNLERLNLSHNYSQLGFNFYSLAESLNLEWLRSWLYIDFATVGFLIVNLLQKHYRAGREKLDKALSGKLL